MSSLSRMLAVLDLFTPQAPAWTAEAIAKQLDYALPTAYRYLRELSAAGLLRSDSDASFVLGSRIVEWDYQIRNGDPLIVAARGPLEGLAARTGCDVVLGSMQGDRIITIHHEFGAEVIGASYGRGRRLPLFRGALSLCIVATLPRARLRKLREPLDTPSWDALLARVIQVRRDGHAISHGELDPGLVGVSVPLETTPHKIPASLGLIMRAQRYGLLDSERAIQLLTDCAKTITARLAVVAAQDPNTHSLQRSE